VDRFDDLLDLLVVVVLPFVWRLRSLGGLALFLCLGFLMSSQGLIEQRFHCAIPSRGDCRPDASILGYLKVVIHSSDNRRFDLRHGAASFPMAHEATGARGVMLITMPAFVMSNE